MQSRTQARCPVSAKPDQPFNHCKHMAGRLSSLWNTECPEQESILRSWAVWERPGGGGTEAEVELSPCPGSDGDQ